MCNPERSVQVVRNLIHDWQPWATCTLREGVALCTLATIQLRREDALEAEKTSKDSCWGLGVSTSYISWRYEENIIQLPWSCFLKNTIEYTCLAAWSKLPRTRFPLIRKLFVFFSRWDPSQPLGWVWSWWVRCFWNCITHQHPYIPCNATTSHIKLVL